MGTEDIVGRFCETLGLNEGVRRGGRPTIPGRSTSGLLEPEGAQDLGTFAFDAEVVGALDVAA